MIPSVSPVREKPQRLRVVYKTDQEDEEQMRKMEKERARRE